MLAVASETGFGLAPPPTTHVNGIPIKEALQKANLLISMKKWEEVKHMLKDVHRKKIIANGEEMMELSETPFPVQDANGLVQLGG